MKTPVTRAQLATSIAVFALLGAALTWPLLTQPSTHTVDAWFAPSQLLTLDVLTKGLLQEGRLIGSTTMIGWPQGGNLSIVGWSYLPLTIPFELLGLGSIAGVHVGMYLQFLAAGLAAYLLIRQLGATHGAALMASCFYAFHPFALSQLHNGQFSELCHWGPPLLLLLLLRIRSGPGCRPILGFGLCFGLLLPSSPYSAITGLIAVCALSFWMLWAAERGRGKLLGRLSLAAAGSCLFAAPFLYYYLVLPAGQTPLLWPSKNTPQQFLEGLHCPGATLSGWFLPPRWAGIGAGAMGLETANVHYLGWLALLVAAAGLLYPRATRSSDTPPRRFWVVLAGITALVSLGYFAMLEAGVPLRIAGAPVPLLQRGVHELWPGIEAFSSTHRLALGVLLCLSVLIATGLDGLMDRMEAPRRSVWAAVIGAALLAEGLFLDITQHPLPTMDLRPRSVHRDLAEIDDGAAMLEIPWWPTPAMPNMQLQQVWQATHGHPMHQGNLGMLREEFPTAFATGLQRRLGMRHPDRGHPEAATCPARWLVVHDYALDPHQRDAVHGYLATWADPYRSYPEEGIQLYRARE